MTKKDIISAARQLATSNFVSMAILDMYREKHGEPLALSALRAHRASIINRDPSAFKRLENEVGKYALPLACLYESIIGDLIFDQEDEDRL